MEFKLWGCLNSHTNHTMAPMIDIVVDAFYLEEDTRVFLHVILV